MPKPSVSVSEARHGVTSQRMGRAGIGALFTVEHAGVAGRLRLRSALLYRADTNVERVRADLGADARIQTLRIRPLTGSVVLTFDPALGAGAIVTRVQQALTALLEDLATTPAPTMTARRAHGNNAVWQPVRPAGPASAHAEADAVPWHSLPASVALRRLDVDLHAGLPADEAAARLLRDGANLLPLAARRSRLSLLLGQFVSGPVLMLGISAIISLATGGTADAVVIAAVVAINAAIGFLTEDYAERTIAALTRLNAGPAQVIRGGATLVLPRSGLVAGDLLLLAPGTQVPADARLIEAEALSLDESALTGESLPVQKSAALLVPETVPLADRRNMVYMGTLVTGGSGLAVTTATGPRTEIGKIQSLVGEARVPETPMQRQLGQMGSQLAWASTAICIGVFGIGLLRGYGGLAMLKSAISLAVAAVPEGLPTVATTTLALGMQRMRRRNALLRRLDAVETLGSVQVLCLDKTGTLTRNRMTAVEIRTFRADVRIDERGFLSEGRVLQPATQPVLARLLETAALCSDAGAAGLGDGGNGNNASATELALVEAARSAGLEIGRLRAQHPRLHTHYRSETRHYMATWHALPHGDGLLVAVKGSPSQVLERCAFVLDDTEPRALDDDLRARILQQNEAMAGAAMRVLGLAYCPAAPRETDSLPPLTWLGLIGMTDPPRHGMRELMHRFQAAGIRTVMITGDQSATAFAIGQQLDLGAGQPLQVLDSTALEQVPPELLTALVERTHVYARVSPAHKLRIVQALQRAGKVVAMTGDGINDSPALRAADIGVAMGEGGSEAAREVADVVLADDNLHTMVEAIEKGRAIYANIRKSIHFLLATNLSEIELMLAGIAFGLGQPLGPTQLLWINLVTDILPALALSMDPPAEDALARPPRDPAEPIIRRADLGRMGLESATITGGALATYGYALARYGAGPAATTHAFTTLTIGQLLHAYSVRSERSVLSDRALPANRYLDVALGASLAAQLAALFVPGLRSLLGTASIGLVDAGVIAGGAGVPFLVNQLTKPGETGKGSRP